MNDEITQAEINEWKQLPVTRFVFACFREAIAEIQRDMGMGRTLNRSSETETLANTSEAVGRIAGINQVLEAKIYDEQETEEG